MRLIIKILRAKLCRCEPEINMVITRVQSCQACPLKDREGIPLFRVSGNDGVAARFTCGQPFTQKPVRNPQKDGCGCKLELKWAVPDEACPNGRW